MVSERKVVIGEYNVPEDGRGSRNIPGDQQCHAITACQARCSYPGKPYIADSIETKLCGIHARLADKQKDQVTLISGDKL